jgi:F420-dependent oxidoreductase-like protein
MRIGLMVEGQNGLTWERWSHILATAERLHFPTVFRSDHYFIGSQQNSLDAFLSFVMAAQQTRTIRFGPLVSPVTFRSPIDVGRMAAQIDRLSGGRFVLGMGAGWNEPEHTAYGIPFPPVKERFDRLEESIQVVKKLWGDGPADFAGRHYQLAGADCLPKPTDGRPPILIGGGGEKRTLKLAARYASEWNCVNTDPKTYAHKVSVLEQHCAKEGRDPASIARSMMVFVQWENLTPRWMTRDGAIAESLDQLVDVVGQLGALGLEEMQFQHFNFDDDTVPEYLAADLAPLVASL